MIYVYLSFFVSFLTNQFEAKTRGSFEKQEMIIFDWQINFCFFSFAKIILTNLFA